MNSDILALKYRPNTLLELVGQENTAQAIINAFNGNNLYNCYLFSGMYGTGKTSVARILAAMENCLKGRTLNPCGTCKNCKDIFSGESNDIREINAASDNGIDVIRSMADFISVRPMSSRIKYVILDEAHALSRQAVESLLKILEEPPKDVRIVLCTTDAHKIKGTIQSRCMPFRFNKVSWQQILEHLKNICQKEGKEAEEGALKIIAKLSEGSIRNSLRNLQLSLNYSGGKLTTDTVQKALSTISDDYWFEYIDSIVDKNVPVSMKIIQTVLNQGADIDQVLSGLTEHLRNLLLLTTCHKIGDLTFFSQEEKIRYEHQIKKLTIDLIIEMINLIYEVYRGISYKVPPQILLESYTIKSIKAHSVYNNGKT